ncbi:MAG: hypothetical protein ACYCPQ_10200 [Elusimicrobiota bacterium]
MIRFLFDGRFYTRQAVIAASRAWKDLVELKITEDGKFIVAQGEGDSRRLDENSPGSFEGEFFNQVLWEMRR